MKLTVSRRRLGDTDRRGNPKNVRFNLRFGLELEPEEQLVIRENELERELIFDSPAKTAYAEDLIGVGAEWSLPRLELAVSVERTVIERCKNFAVLVAIARGFDGTEEVAL